MKYETDSELGEPVWVKPNQGDLRENDIVATVHVFACESQRKYQYSMLPNTCMSSSAVSLEAEHRE